MSVENLRELKVYQKSMELRQLVSILAKQDLPRDDKYRLTDQILRSSRSVTANIAEGHGRYHYQENIQYLRIARGSLLETQDHIDVALEEQYIKKDKHLTVSDNIDQCTRLFNGYIKFLKDKKIGTR